MVERFGGATDGRESSERIKPVEVNFFKLGGTWDMVFRDGQKIGTGNLDDDSLKEIQSRAGYFTGDQKQLAAVDRQIAIDLYARFQSTEPEKLDAGEHLSAWAHIDDLLGEQFKDFV